MHGACDETEMVFDDVLASTERIAKLPSLQNLIDCLHGCRKDKNLEYAKRLHLLMINNELDVHEELGNYLVPALTECGALSIAQEVFDRLEKPNAYSWTALLHGLNDKGEFHQAFDLFKRMRDERVQPSCYSLQALVRTCASMKSLEKGGELHVTIVKWGHDSNQILVVTLIDMYTKCGSFAEAWAMCEQMSTQDIVAYNILITGYVDHGLADGAIECLRLMQAARVSPDIVSFMGSLKACGIIHAIQTGKEIHDFVIALGFEENVAVSNTLVDMYAKCGSITEAESVFDKMPIRDVVSWNALLAVYAEHDFERGVLDYLDRMHSEGVSLSHVTIALALSCCRNLANIDKGSEMHGNVVKGGLESHPVVVSSLVEMYATCGALAEAQNVFHTLPVRNLVSWTALISGYAAHGLMEQAFDGYVTLLSEPVSLDAPLVVCILRCCHDAGAVDKALRVHCDAAKEGLESYGLVASTLVELYTTNDLVSEAQDVFDELPVSHAVLCNVSAAWYAQHARGVERVITWVEDMLSNGSLFGAPMFLGSLKACAGVGAIELGCKLHMEAVKEGLEKDFSLENALLAMYAKCCRFLEAHFVHNHSQGGQDVMNWNTIIACYVDHGILEQVLVCVDDMRMKGVSLDNTSMVYALKACGNLGAMKKGLELHADIAKEGLESDPFVGNALVAMYAKYPLLTEALDVFHELGERDVVSWNTIMATYMDIGEVLACWQEMEVDGVTPNSVSYICGLKVCVSMCVVDKGLQFHREVIKKGLEQNTHLANTLLDMYAKSGFMVEASQILEKLPNRSVMLWTAFMDGLASCGQSDTVFDAFEQLRNEGEQPNEGTCLSVLTACSHAGLLKEGLIFFHGLLSHCFGNYPRLQHCNGVIDLLGRAGQLNKVWLMWKMMPFQPSLVTLRAVMTSCRKWGNLELGRHAFEGVIGLSDREMAAFVLMLNMYAGPQEWEEAQELLDKFPP